VGIADERRVVAADDRAVKGRADALVGLRTDDDEAPDREVGQHVLERRVLEGVGVGLLHARLGLAGAQLRDDPPLVAPTWQPVVGVLHPHNRDLLLARSLDEAADVRHHRVALVRPLDDAVLDVDDEERGVRPVLECGHGLPRVVPALSA
jgi:hypothetical protein